MKLDLTRARALYATGLTLRQVAAEMGAPLRRLRSYLEATGGYGARPPGIYARASKEDRERIYLLLRQGKTGDQITAATGHGDALICGVAREHGFKRTMGPHCAAPGRRRYLYVGEGARAQISQVWCSKHGAYCDLADMRKSARDPKGYGSWCLACSRANSAANHARKKTQRLTAS